MDGERRGRKTGCCTPWQARFNVGQHRAHKVTVFLGEAASEKLRESGENVGRLVRAAHSNGVIVFTQFLDRRRTGLRSSYRCTQRSHSHLSLRSQSLRADQRTQLPVAVVSLVAFFMRILAQPKCSYPAMSSTTDTHALVNSHLLRPLTRPTHPSSSTM